MCIFPAEVRQGNILSSCVNSHTVNNYLVFCSVSWFGVFGFFFSLLHFLLAILLFKMALGHSAKVLPSVPKSKKVLDVPYGENTYVR